jgi:hypothetical protein
MIGTGQASWARIIASNSRCCSAQASSVMPLRSFRSAPAWKWRPSPARITQRRRLVGAQLRPGVQQLAAHLAGERVGDLRPREADDGDAGCGSVTLIVL